MIWDDRARSYLLADDECFQTRYCAPPVFLPGEGRRSGTLQRIRPVSGPNAQDMLSKARSIILSITQLVPHGAHVTPTYGPGDQPVISVGRLKASGRISGPHFGLCQFYGRFHIWCPRRVLARWPVLLRERRPGEGAGWIQWRDGEDHAVGNAILIYSEPVDAASTSPLVPGGEVHTLLLAIEDLIQPQPGAADAGERLAAELFPLRRLLGEPEGLTAIYPGLMASKRQGSAFLGRAACRIPAEN